MRRTPSDPPTPTNWTIPVLIAGGLAVRLLGLLVYGMHDLDEMLLDWGASVSRLGLADAFGINYGLVSYAVFGPVFEAGELVPRFWWAPYKLLVLGFDMAVLIALLRFTRGASWGAVLWLYWLNPWFILHEAWLGFWEAPLILTALLAALAVRGLGTGGRGWFAAGALVAIGAMIKPQGLLYFIGPVGLILGVHAVADRAWVRVSAFATGVIAALLATALWIAAIGGTPFQLVANYGTAFTVMPSLSNGGPGLWRAVTHLYMALTGQSGHVSTVRLDGMTLALATEAAGIVCLLLVVVFAVRLRRPTDGTPREATAWGWLTLLMLGLGALVMSQFGVRAHINHSYAAMVLLVPIACRDPGFRRSWAAMTVLLGVSHILLYGTGRAILLPSPHDAATYPHAQELVARVASLPPFAQPDTILSVQAAVNGVVFAAPADVLVTLLSPLVFLAAVAMTRDLFRIARSGVEEEAVHA